jgi:hypothetical protein
MPMPVAGNTAGTGVANASVLAPAAVVPFSVMPSYSRMPVQTAVVPAPSKNTL